MRAVLDSNVLISAFLFFDRDTVPARLLRLFAQKRFVLRTCPAILREVEGALLRDPRTPERYGYTSERVALFCSTLAADARVVDPLPLSGVTRDPDDDVVLACALAAPADGIVSGDNDLRSLAVYGNIPIHSPRAFLTRIEATG